MSRAKPLRWRLSTDDDGAFDELVVHGRGPGRHALLHAEMMDRRSIFVSVGGVCLWATVGRDGHVRVTGAEGATLDPATMRRTR